jgi:hypothetical protein
MVINVFVDVKFRFYRYQIILLNYVSFSVLTLRILLGFEICSLSCSVYGPLSYDPAVQFLV